MRTKRSDTDKNELCWLVRKQAKAQVLKQNAIDQENDKKHLTLLY